MDSTIQLKGGGVWSSSLSPLKWINLFLHEKIGDIHEFYQIS